MDIQRWTRRRASIALPGAEGIPYRDVLIDRTTLQSL